ncbi:MAG: energy transducer TonB [Candidatus Methylomirabilales bacterium]
MAGWSNRLSRIFLPWGSSVLLHALILLLLPWLVVISLPPHVQQAVEVELVGLLPGGGGGAPRSQEAPAPTPPPQTPVSVKASPPPVVPKKNKKEPKPVETVANQQKQEPVAAVNGTEQPTTESGTSETDVAAPRERVEAKTNGARAGAGGMGTWLSAVPGPGGGVSAGFGRGGVDWRQLLRQRIERAKRYPARARRLGMQGTVHVEFRIARDGSVEGVKVAKSSGYPLLDEASVKAIKRAAPLPIVPGKIRVPISYLLRKGP